MRCNHITRPNIESEISKSHYREINSLDGDVSFYLNGANPLQGGAVVKGGEVFAVHFNLQHIDEICRSMHNLCTI